MTTVVQDIDWDTAMGRREGRQEMIGEIIAMHDEARDSGATVRAAILHEVWIRLRDKDGELRAADVIE